MVADLVALGATPGVGGLAVVGEDRRGRLGRGLASGDDWLLLEVPTRDWPD